MKKFVALLLIVVTLLTLSACGSKDAVSYTHLTLPTILLV